MDARLFKKIAEYEKSRGKLQVVIFIYDVIMIFMNPVYLFVCKTLPKERNKKGFDVRAFNVKPLLLQPVLAIVEMKQTPG